MTSTTTEWCWTRSRRRCRPVSSTRCSPTPSTKASSSAAPTTASSRSASSACPKTRFVRCPTRSSHVFSFHRLLAVRRHFGGHLLGRRRALVYPCDAVRAPPCCDLLGVCRDSLAANLAQATLTHQHTLAPTATRTAGVRDGSGDHGAGRHGRRDVSDALRRRRCFHQG